MVLPGDFVVGLKDIDHQDKHYVGERAANLGSIAMKFPVPMGFVVAFPSYFEFLRLDNLESKISHLLGAVNYDLPESVDQVSSYIRQIITNSHIPSSVVQAVIKAYELAGSPRALVQTTIISGDQAQSFFERSYKDYDIYGESSLLDALRSSWASIFTPELINYRNKKRISHLKSGVSAFVTKYSQPMISGKILTADPHIGDRSKIIVQAASDFVEHLVNKKDMSVRKRAKRFISSPYVFVRDTYAVKNSLDDNEIVDLAKLGDAIEKHFYFPQAIDWIKENGKFYVTNTRNLNFYA